MARPPFFKIVTMKKEKERPRLKTNYPLSEIPFNDYPRPTMVRDSYICLNGTWKVKSSDYDGDILVPYPPESRLSGIERDIGSKFTYERQFTIPQGFIKDRVLLHFGAVDQIATVYVNGVEVIKHEGGYTSFSCDITDYLSQINTLTVEVVDELDTRLPYGKQSKRSKGMWYTKVSGIWQTVWLESVPEVYVKGLTVDTKEGIKITADGITDAVVTVTTPDGEKVYQMKDGVCEFSITAPSLWSPKSPYLYQYVVDTGEDRVSSYFAIRSIGIVETKVGKRISLNGKPYFMHGLLDQGYWCDGIFLPPSTKAYVDEINRLKLFGFNMIRKHVKVEPEIFYYLCDKLGIVVFQDMVNNGKYRFFRDTLLPNLGFTRKNDRRTHMNSCAREAFLKSMTDTVNQLKKHPCICYWTIFNEGWGQFLADDCYKLLKKLDDTRLIDTTSGWFTRNLSDVKSVHSYFFNPKIDARDRAQVLSEFGGASYFVERHNCALKSYGYGRCKSREDFVQSVKDKYLKVIEWKKKGLSASVYTQLSDIEDELNGIITYNRMVEKIHPDELGDLSKELTEEEEYEI